MNKRELDLLETAFSAEIDAAIGRGIGLIQTRSKLAKKLEDEGYLVKEVRRLSGAFPMTVEGYRLTSLGHLTYCTSDRCADD